MAMSYPLPPIPATTPIRSVLVANRGEIAVRVIRTLARMGLKSIAVYSDADASSLHVAMADEAVWLGPTPAQDSYLNVERVIAAARSSSADAIHPGYGFLSENTSLAQACADNGIVFIGPPSSVIDGMGDKIQAKVTAIAAGVPVVPGRHDADMSDEQLTEAILHIGFPALLKPSAGGGGKGMRIVHAAQEIPDAIESARRESRGAFGDDTLLVERFVEKPRHIEVQILADTHGSVIHLGERECSLQRRHQKVIEESPSPLLDEHARAAICDSAVRLAQSVGYVGAGTVEFVVPSGNPLDFAFLEMNTRLQVEHPVTEAVTGIDLVAEQIRIAAGEPLGYTQQDIVFRGVAVEARIYAEDPMRGSLPTGGTIEVWEEPQGVRVDAGVRSGDVIGSHYDPMLAKVIAWSFERAKALKDLDAALADMIIFGVVTNIDYLRQIVSDPRVQSGDLDTELLANLPPVDSWAVDGPSTQAGVDIVNAYRLGLNQDSGAWSSRDGWRIGGVEPLELDWVHADASWSISGVSQPISLTATIWSDGETIWFHSAEAGTHHGRVALPIDRRLRQPGLEASAGGSWTARSPMPGVIVNIAVAPDEEVSAGTPLIAVEAMKMEHVISAPAAGTVDSINVEVGQQVTLDQALLDLHLGDQRGGDHDA